MAISCLAAMICGHISENCEEQQQVAEGDKEDQRGMTHGATLQVKEIPSSSLQTKELLLLRD